MNDTLKVAGRIGAELGAAKAEVERLKSLMRQALPCIAMSTNSCAASYVRQFEAALSPQAEPCGGCGNADESKRCIGCGHQFTPAPTDTFAAVDMATAAAQGFRDGQAAVEQAAAQDGREAFKRALHSQRVFKLSSATINAAEWAWFHRPAQTEQPATVKESLTVQPMAYAVFAANGNVVCFSTQRDHPSLVALESEGKSVVSLSPIAQTAPQGKFRMGDLVKKSSGSEWVGRVVGWYSTNQTPEGYAVESEAHAGSVQIYPAKALEAVE